MKDELIIEYGGVPVVKVTLETALQLQQDEWLFGNSFVTKDGKRIPPSQISARLDSVCYTGDVTRD